MPGDTSISFLFLFQHVFYNQNVISRSISQPEPNPKTQTTKLNSAEAPIAQKVPICQMHTLLDTPGSKHNTNTTAQHNHLQNTTRPPVGTYHNELSSISDHPKSAHLPNAHTARHSRLKTQHKHQQHNIGTSKPQHNHPLFITS